ncbi:uncharacterized protein LOC117580438 [Drosophila guanche]|uniref:uncharacterized protein LOC117580438 n=1 Tax=Drosophila guanche TaxID=7266 RepID=UPI0014725287|nr:uncharacterized protein LOC117580438 [Drosophila guanche]
MLKIFTTISLIFFHHLVATQAVSIAWEIDEIAIVQGLQGYVSQSSFIFQTGKCRFNEKYFDNFTMTIVNNTLDLDMVTPRTIPRGLKVLIDVQISLDMGKSYQRLFAHILDTCNVVSSVKTSIFKSWFESMRKHGNFMANCPVPEGQYFLRNWKLDSQLVPNYLMPGDYRVLVHFFYGKQKTNHEEFALDMDIYAMVSK